MMKWEHDGKNEYPKLWGFALGAAKNIYTPRRSSIHHIERSQLPLVLLLLPRLAKSGLACLEFGLQGGKHLTQSSPTGPCPTSPDRGNKEIRDVIHWCEHPVVSIPVGLAGGNDDAALWPCKTATLKRASWPGPSRRGNWREGGERETGPRARRARLNGSLQIGGTSHGGKSTKSCLDY